MRGAERDADGRMQRARPTTAHTFLSQPASLILCRSLESITEPKALDFIKQCINHDPTKRPPVEELLKHPFLEEDDNDYNRDATDLMHKENEADLSTDVVQASEQAMQILAEAREEAAQILADSKQKSDEILEEAKKTKNEIIESAMKERDKIIESAKMEAKAISCASGAAGNDEDQQRLNDEAAQARSSLMEEAMKTKGDLIESALSERKRILDE